jgi:hypothetical protein
MTAIRKIIRIENTTLQFEVPKNYQGRDVEIIILPLEKKKKKKTRYDFSDLIGKLHWKGNAVAEQRKLRDEW